MRQYSGFGTAVQTNERFRYLLEQGQSGLSVAFDLPTQMGTTPTTRSATGEVGKVGVAISSLEDMEELLAGIPLDKVSTSMTINATASILLAFYVAVAKRQGIDPARDLGDDPERSLEGVHRPRDVHLSAGAVATHHDRPVRVVRRAHAEVEHDLDLRLPHARGRSDGGAGGRVHAGQRDRLLRGGDRARPSVRLVRRAPLVLLQRARELLRGGREVPRRAAPAGRASSATRFGVADPELGKLRFHTQTAGSTLTAQQPEVNVVRTTLQALSAVLWGTQSLHTNSMDEALGLPTEDAALLALRTQQVIALRDRRRGHRRPARAGRTSSSR